MLAFRRGRLCLPLALVLAPLGCQSILGIDSDRPLVPPDAGQDAGPHPQEDAGPGGDVATDAVDSSADTSNADSGGFTSDASDASDAPSTLEAATDAPAPTSFTNPVQVDATSLFTANSVVTTAAGGATLTPMDGNGMGAGNDFPTESEVLVLSASAAGQGLPDDAFFPSIGATMPDVQLAWSNTKNVLNSLVLSATSGQHYTFDLPKQPYTKVQIYATGAGGGSTLNYSLNYVGSPPTASSMSLPDWCTGTPGGGQYILASVYRVENNGTTLNTAFSCHIYALDLNPDPGLVLGSVTFWDTGQAPANFVFYGATAW